MSVPRRTLLAALPLLVAGCGTPLRTPPLAITPRQALQWRSFVDEQLRGQIALGEVQGADEPAVGFLQQALAFVWGSPVAGQVVLDALEDQLRALRLLASAAEPGRYRLDARLIQLEVGGLIGSAEAQARVEYTVREREEGGRLIYQRQVRSEGKAGWLDHAFTADRQRLAKEAALRAGLVLLAQDLVALRV
ncbi:hypothetical protein [Inhella sp.]|uniref:hypothetical protein n=1 Tax=Inhella sp. TaxID=1921806 RepID=UPI0035B15A70